MSSLLKKAKAKVYEDDLLQVFLKRFAEKNPIFFKEIERSMKAHPDLFHELVGIMLPWAALQLGTAFPDPLIDGYCSFTINVNRSQLLYEKSKKYLNSNYKEVFENAYGSQEFMNLYHWGVFTATFVWAHHLCLYQVYRDRFLSRLAHCGGRLLDLGAGSGVWHLLAFQKVPQWEIYAVDISETSVKIAQEMSAKLGFGNAIFWNCADALTFQLSELADAGISCFLLEHLETPKRLLENLGRNLKPGAYAFVTLAITAAEYDHIFEFKRESEPILLAETAGFRVVESFSSAPDTVPKSCHFLPRSMAMVLQKRKGEIW